MEELAKSLEEMARKRLGTTLRAKYHLEELLGIGGMAAVYAATHRNRARLAIKMLHPQYAVMNELRLRFLREGYAANTVGHPGVVSIVDDDVSDGEAFIVMERLDGVGCDRLLEHHAGQMPIALAIGIAMQLLDVLEVAHAKGVLHRDIKPSNLFLTREGQLKVLDFGIAKVHEQASGGPNTTAGHVMGTPAFMGPEQALAKAELVDARTDLWAVGATLFTMITGTHVHTGDNANQILVKAATARPAPLASVAPRVPAEIAAVIDRALEYMQDDRWPNARAMADALEETTKPHGGYASKAQIADHIRRVELEWAAEVEPSDTEMAVGGTLASTQPEQVVAVASIVSGARTEPLLQTSPPQISNPPAATLPSAGTVPPPSTAISVASTIVPKPRSPALVAITVLVPLFVVAGVVTAFFVRRTEPISSAPAPAASSLASEPSARTPVPSAEPSAAPSATPSVIASASAAPIVARPTKKSPSPPLTPSASAAPCKLVETIDADGQHHFKKVCP